MTFIDSVIKQELSITESPKFFDLEFKNQHVDFTDKEKMIEVGKKLCANNLFIRIVHCLSLIASETTLPVITQLANEYLTRIAITALKNYAVENPTEIAERSETGFNYTLEYTTL